MNKAHEHWERRKQAVAAVQRGEMPTVVARVCHLPLRTLFHWLSLYRAGGWDGLRDKARSGRPPKLTGEMMQWLYQIITLGNPQQLQLPFCLWTLGVLRVALKQRWGVVVSKSALCRLLAQMGLTPQRPLYKSYKQDPRELEQYLTRTFPQLREEAKRRGAEIYFVDESAVRSEHHRGQTWGVCGQTPILEDSGSRFTVKLISAVSPRGDMRFLSFEGRMTQEKFVDFLKKLRRDAGKPIVVITDNATYHGGKRVGEFVAQQGEDVQMEKLPKYAPALNPDEQVWNHAKRRLSQCLISSKEVMKKSLRRIMRSIQRDKELIRSFFQMKDTQYAAI